MLSQYRFGVRWINGYAFTIGRTYQIELRDSQDREMKIRFGSLYGIGKKEASNLYAGILDKLWTYYFRDMANRFLHMFWNGQTFSIGDVTFSRKHLKVKKKGLLTDRDMEISWDKVRAQDYHTYFVIYSAADPARENQSFSYLDDWNVDVLRGVVMAILENIRQK